MCQHTQVDSFCTTYQKVVRAKGEGAIKASPDVKRRILSNEVTYRGLCETQK